MHELIEKHLRNTHSVALIGPFATQVPEDGTPLIFIDRGTRLREQRQGIAVGDGDSHSGPLDIRLSPEKDYSDLAFVLGALPEPISRVQLIGFLGGRKDHELANYGEVHKFLKNRPVPASVHWDNALQSFSNGTWEIELHGTFSVFVFETAKLQIRGSCQYPLSQPTGFEPVTSWGLSNEGYGLVQLSNDNPVFVFTPT